MLISWDLPLKHMGIQKTSPTILKLILFLSQLLLLTIISYQPDPLIKESSIHQKNHWLTQGQRLAKPALDAGKMVFVEWPLAATMTQNEELVTLAKSKNAKTIVGLQARADPLVLKLKQLVRQLDYRLNLTLILPP